MLKINIGDRVHVNFYGSRVTLSIDASVLKVPEGPGDSWIFRDYGTEQVHVVSEPCTVSTYPGGD